MAVVVRGGSRHCVGQNRRCSQTLDREVYVMGSMVVALYKIVEGKANTE